jgi:hypothetical protein
MHDQDGPEIARSIYSELFDGKSTLLSMDDVPYALDTAVRKLRERGLPLSRWAPYVHFGL